MLPRALMAPPGFPEFATRSRIVPAGPCLLEGRAWSGLGEVEAVEVSTDGGGQLGAPPSSRTTSARRGRGAAGRSSGARPPGEHELCCRARDAAGNEQPLEPSWNLGGYANNAVQRVPVTVA